MTTAIMPLARVIDALGRLNQHARAYGDGKRAIYAYKILAAAQLIIQAQATVQLVRWQGTCGHCSGTGRYVGWDGEKWPHCRRCRSTGKVELRFAETTLPDGQTWHHPFEYGKGGVDLAQLAGAATWNGQRGRYEDAHGNEPVFWNIVNGWTPRQPSQQLDPEPLAELLNAVESWVLEFAPSPALRWMYETARREMRGYSIDLGRISATCWYCNSPDIYCGLGRIGVPFSWSAPVCRAHHSMDVDLWPSHAELPESAVTPALAEWRLRHVRLGFDDVDRGSA